MSIFVQKTLKAIDTKLTLELMRKNSIYLEDLAFFVGLSTKSLQDYIFNEKHEFNPNLSRKLEECLQLIELDPQTLKKYINDFFSQVAINERKVAQRFSRIWNHNIQLDDLANYIGVTQSKLIQEIKNLDSNIPEIKELDGDNVNFLKTKTVDHALARQL